MTRRLNDLSPGAPLAPRTVEIRPPDVRAEIVLVLRLGAAIFCGAFLWVALATAGSPGGEATAATILPYQMLFGDLSGHDQRIFRQMQEGLLEAERARSRTGAWPDVATLAADGIPPFAGDPLSEREGYSWSFRQEGPVVNYLGTASMAGAPAFLIVIREPSGQDPSERNVPADDTHHYLDDGTTILHVSLWSRAGKGPAGDFAVEPASRGWTQLVRSGQSPLP